MKCKILLFLSALLLSQRLLASLMSPLSIDEMTARAQLIVHGKVVSKSCQRDAAGRIYTEVDLEVSEVWKGNHSEKRLVVVHGGGTLGEERVVVSNQVQYEIGEEVVAFCVLNSRGEAVTLGLCQGKFQVWKDEAGQLRARNPFHGTGKSQAGHISLRNSNAPISDRLTLMELKDRVKGKEGQQ
jgi:hypothetical protein